MERRRTFPALVALVLAPLSACAPEPWVEHPMEVAPDRSCRTGGHAGHDVYTWYCHGGRHVVVVQHCSALLGCRRAQKETAPCGELTPFERRGRPEVLQVCAPTPRAWRI